MSAFTRRHLQVALGILWLLDGGLQLQPFMFSHSFLTHVIEPTAAGQPRFVAVSILRAAHLMSRHLAFDNSGAAAIQVLIGVGMLVPRTVKPALLVSFAWALGVWALGEGFGVLPACPPTSPPTGPALPSRPAAASHRARWPTWTRRWAGRAPATGHRSPSGSPWWRPASAPASCMTNGATPPP